MGKKLNIMLVLKSGGRYSIKDVRLLAFHLEKWKGGLDISIYCMNDVLALEVKLFGVQFIPLPYPWKHWWSKMNLFCPSFDISKLKPFLYLDLDTLVIGEYADLIPKGKDKSKFIMLKDFYRPKNSASAVMWIPDADKLEFLWNWWTKQIDKWMVKFRGDQDFIQANVKVDCHWQDKIDLIGSFKPRPKMKPLKEKPKGKAIICFHGKPSIWEAGEKIKWVAEHIKEGGVQ